MLFLGQNRAFVSKNGIREQENPLTFAENGNFKGILLKY